MAVSSIASVGKPSTSSWSSGKSRISNQNSNSGSREWTHNEIIELIDIWKEEEALYNIRHIPFVLLSKTKIKTRSSIHSSVSLTISSAYIYIIEGTCIRTIFQTGFNPYTPFSFCFLLCSIFRKYILY